MKLYTIVQDDFFLSLEEIEVEERKNIYVTDRCVFHKAHVDTQSKHWGYTNPVATTPQLAIDLQLQRVAAVLEPARARYEGLCKHRDALVALADTVGPDMPKPFTELFDKLSPEAQARVRASVEKELAEIEKQEQAGIPQKEERDDEPTT